MEFGLASFASRSQPLSHNIDNHHECQSGIAGEEHKVEFAHGLILLFESYILDHAHQFDYVRGEKIFKISMREKFLTVGPIN